MAAKWRELADKLAERIKAGEYAPGQQLPHIRDLVEGGEGSKSTVHAAYKALEAEGLVTSSRGHGTVVRQQAPLKRLGIARYDKAKWRDGDEVAFIADRVASGRAYKRGEQTQSVSRVTATPLVAAAHGLPEGSDVYARARLVKEGINRPTPSRATTGPSMSRGRGLSTQRRGPLAAAVVSVCCMTRATRSTTCARSCSRESRRPRRRHCSSCRQGSGS